MNTYFLLQADGAGGGGMSMLIMMVAIFAIMYFFLIRKKKKKKKEIRNFQNSLSEGSRVVTGGGIYGTVKRIDTTTNKVEVEIARNVVIEVDKSYVFADASSMAAGQPSK